MSFDVPFIRPVFPASAVIASDFDAIVESNWYTNFGPMERRFAEAIADTVGAGYRAVTFANATVGLLALVHSTLGRGDDTKYVIVPSFTFAAGPEAIIWAGYKPLLVDIDPVSLQPSLDAARSALSSGGFAIAGVLLCNTFGIGNAEVEEWETLAADAGVPLLIDSAAGFGSAYSDGSPVGTRGLAEVFSFHATKPFAIGEGGAVVTRDNELADRLAAFQNFGFRNRNGAADIGLNGKLQEINAAIGLRQLETFDGAVASRQNVVEQYRGALADTSVYFPHNIERSSVCFASVIFDGVDARERARIALTSAGVEVRSYYSPVVHEQPFLRDAARIGELATTDDIAKRILSLPVHQNMNPEHVERIVSTIVNSESK
jgi:dTDP-4-amino-4,6-dideoxygalactose transaminase